MKIITWNVNGIRAITKKTFFEDVKILNPDILCIQETKAQDKEVQEALSSLTNYKLYTNSAIKKGYSGTAILTKETPLHIYYNIPNKDEHNSEGRFIAAEFKNFILVNVYVPNSGTNLVRLDYREDWDNCLRNELKSLETKKSIILCGDLNVAHQPIDIARPDANYNKTPGYTQREIDGFSKHLNENFIDVWRQHHLDKVEYSWWSYRAGARQKNIGWRLDYFLASQSIFKNIKKSKIHTSVLGSDHCPVEIEIESHITK